MKHFFTLAMTKATEFVFQIVSVKSRVFLQGTVHNVERKKNSKYITVSLAKKLDFFQTQFGKHAVALIIGKVQKCFIPHLKALKVIFNFQCQNFPKV